MSKPSAQLTLSGKVHHSQGVFASVGDVAIHPGARRTTYIDATIFDGGEWRALDLGGFGFRKSDRIFSQADPVGPLMRQIEQSIGRRRGATVHYEVPAGGKNRKYVYRGMSYP
jgi:hypothetical protein